MYTIKENIIDEIIINKSRFIAYLYIVNNEEKCKTLIEELWREHKNATHICYAYIIDNTKRFNDDGEPGGTAGMPILNVLDNNKINNILCCVVRYFGGIKLGAGGLVRAYTNSTSGAILKSELIKLVPGYKISLKFNYDKVKLVDNVLKEIKIIDKLFTLDIEYIILLKKEQINIIHSLGSYEILESIMIEDV